MSAPPSSTAEYHRHQREYMRANKHRFPSKQPEYERDYLRGMRQKARAAGTLSGRPWRELRANAKMRGLPFNLPEGALEIPERCPVLGIPLDCSNRDHTPSVDRIDSRLGYVLGNCAVISFRANRKKQDLALWEVRRLAEYMQPKTERSVHHTLEWSSEFTTLAAVGVQAVLHKLGIMGQRAARVDSRA